MPKKRRLQFNVTGPARRDIVAIVKRSLREFGAAASRRYRALIRQALLDIQSDHQRPGSKERPEIMVDGARTYHISLSRTRVSGTTVKEPRHFILYRYREDGVISFTMAATLLVTFLRDTVVWVLPILDGGTWEVVTGGTNGPLARHERVRTLPTGGGSCRHREQRHWPTVSPFFHDAAWRAESNSRRHTLPVMRFTNGWSTPIRPRRTPTR